MRHGLELRYRHQSHRDALPLPKIEVTRDLSILTNT